MSGTVEGMRTNIDLGWRVQTAPSPRWCLVAVWLPAGLAATRLVGDGTPLLVTLFVLAALGGLHRVLPGLVELAAGGAAVALTLFEVVDRTGCGEVLHTSGKVILVLYGSVMSTSAFVRLLGSASLREMARHLLVATAALQLSLFAVSPLGHAVAGARDRYTVPAVLLVILVVATFVGLRLRYGLPVLGAGLVASLAVLTVTGSSCTAHPAAALLGMLTFAAVAFAANRDRVA